MPPRRVGAWAPRGQHAQEISDADLTVVVEVRNTVAIAWSPQGQDHQEVVDAHLPVTIEVGVAVRHEFSDHDALAMGDVPPGRAVMQRGCIGAAAGDVKEPRC